MALIAQPISTPDIAMLVYRLLIILLSPVFLGHIIWKAASNRQGRYFWQRLGFDYSSLPRACAWFHCASVGEVNTLLPLLKNLHHKNDQLNFIITTNTVTGASIVQQQKLPYLFHSYLPFDWRFSINRFLRATRPLALYVLETEIWPNLFARCAAKNVDIHIINARLSSRTTSASSWVRALLRSSLSRVSTISARSAQDASAYQSLGADKDRISLLGNLKFTTAINTAHSEENNFAPGRDYILVASTHDDEEIQIYDAWKKLARRELLVIAPRHPERGASITRKLGCDHIATRSKAETVSDSTQLFLLDTVGELKNYFANAKLVIMGGSFVPVGGHNILEPASYNSAIITGPYMENFKEELALMLEKDAIVQLDSTAELQEKLAALLDDEAQLDSLRENTALLSHDVEKVLADYSELILAKYRATAE
jgi:3-deoxy-D-manno-octulosonic-acid transferase